MPLTIWKYPLQIVDEQQFTIPRRHRILSIQLQLGIPIIWALVDPDPELNDDITFHIKLVGTGQKLPDNCNEYVGTFLYMEDTLVFHVFSGELGCL